MRTGQFQPNKISWKITRRDIFVTMMAVAVCLLDINYLLYAFFENSAYKTLFRAISLIIMLILFFNKENIQFSQVVLLGIAAYTLALNGEMALNIAFVVIAATVVDPENPKVLRRINAVDIVLLIVVWISLQTGAVNTKITAWGDRTRNAFGFINVNAASLFAYSIGVIFLISRKKIRWYHMILSVAFAYYVYVETDSRTSFYGFVVFAVVYILLGKVSGEKLTVLFAIIQLIMFASPFIICFASQKLPELSEMLSGRPGAYNRYMNNNGLFNLAFGGGKGSVESFYLQLLYNVGLPFFCIFAFTIISSTIKYMKAGKRTQVATIMSVLTVGISEAGALCCEIPCVIIFWGLVLRQLYMRGPIAVSQAHLNDKGLT